MKANKANFLHRSMREKIFFSCFICSMLFLCKCATTETAPLARSPVIAGTSVKDLELINSDGKYRALITQNYASISPETAFKFRKLRDNAKGFRWDEADRFIAFAKANRLAVHGHVLVWHSATLDWLYDLSNQELSKVLETHIKTTVKHFGQDIAIWDVVNEAFTRDGTLRPATRDKTDRNGNLWRNIGDDYIANAFRWAEYAASEVHARPILLYNDFNIETINAKSDAVLALAVKLKQDGIPIDGVGFQFHLDLEDIDRIKSFEDAVRANLTRFTNAGLQVHITELDVSGCYSEADLKKEADVYRAVATVCRDLTNCKSLTTWGTTDRYSWLREPMWGGKRASEQRPLPFDDAYQPKSAFNALNDVIGIKNAAAVRLAAIAADDGSDVMPNPTTTDVEILKRADKILSDETKWNRHDTRECSPSDRSWSLYCALHLASIQITGHFNHRSAALQATRKTVEQMTAGMTFEHRMMDYNNLETTTFKDIKRILGATISRLNSELPRP